MKWGEEKDSPLAMEKRIIIWKRANKICKTEFEKISWAEGVKYVLCQCYPSEY